MKTAAISFLWLLTPALLWLQSCEPVSGPVVLPPVILTETDDHWVITCPIPFQATIAVTREPSMGEAARACAILADAMTKTGLTLYIPKPSPKLEYFNGDIYLHTDSYPHHCPDERTCI